MPANATILFAGFGVWNATMIVTADVQGRYDTGLTAFSADAGWGDPCPGQTQYLFIFWSVPSDSSIHSGVVGQGSGKTISIP